MRIWRKNDEEEKEIGYGMAAERNPVTGHFQEWVPPTDIYDIIFKKKCCISDIARALNISRETFYRHLRNNHELKAIFDKVREELDTEWLDQAEKVIWYTMALAESRPGLAFKAATYITDKRGKSRGWEGSSQESDHAPKLDELFEGYSKLQKSYSARKQADISNNEESKS